MASARTYGVDAIFFVTRALARASITSFWLPNVYPRQQDDSENLHEAALIQRRLWMESHLYCVQVYSAAVDLATTPFGCCFDVYSPQDLHNNSENLDKEVTRQTWLWIVNCLSCVVHQVHSKVKDVALLFRQMIVALFLRSKQMATELKRYCTLWEELDKGCI